MKKIEVSEIGKYKLEREIPQHTWNNIQEKRAELKNFEGVCTVKEFISVSEEDGKFYPEHGYVLLEYRGYLLFPVKKHYNQNSYKFLIDGNDYPYGMLPDYRKEHEEPNYVGKATVKKMDEWLDFLLFEERFINERIKNKYNFKEAYIKSLEDEGREIVWRNNDRTEGEIYGNGFTFCITIGEGAVYTKIKFDPCYKKDGKYVMEKLETFDLLSKAMQ